MRRKILLLIVCILSFCMFLFFGLQLLLEQGEYRKGQSAYQQLTQYIQTETEAVSAEPEQTEHAPAAQDAPAEETDNLPSETETAEPEQEETVVWPTVDFQTLAAVNPDVAAWIYLEGTEINYPVVQGADNEEYLDRLFDGSHNRLGSVFIDYRNSPDFTDRNTILYGHHAKDGLMFTSIIQYKEQAYYEEHPSCMILTPDGNYVVEFFAGYVANLNENAWKLYFESDEEFAAWQEEAISKSTFQSDIIPTAQDRVVTLSTCIYDFQDARYVLLGVIR